MPMLKRMMAGRCTLIDYEKITDETGKRLIFFGRYAGDVGAINILWLMGEYWQHKGIDNPFVAVKQAIHYHSLAGAQEQVQQVGENIRQHGLPPELSPLIIGILGYGNVSKGAQSVFECLPVQRVQPEELAGIVHANNVNAHSVYLTVFEERHLVHRKSDGGFDLQEYFQNPERYESQFEQYLPYLSVLLNAVYWEPGYPRFVTCDALKRLSASGKLRLQGIADVTCDVKGSVECNVKVTGSGAPAYRYLPAIGSIDDDHLGEGIVVLAVDNLPAELPNDASVFFSNQLKPFIPAMANADFDAPLEQTGLPPEVQKAVILYHGELTPAYRYLEQYL